MRNAPSPGKSRLESKLLQRIGLSSEIYGCCIISYYGSILGEAPGDLGLDDEVRSRRGEIAAVIWGGLKKFEGPFGQLRMVSAVYEKYKVVGIPFSAQNFGILVTVSVGHESRRLRDRIVDYVEYWVRSG